MPDDLDIPAFLKIPAAERKAAWANVKLTKAPKEPRAKRQRRDLPKSMEAASWAILKEQENAKAARKAERLAALKELNATKRRARTKRSK